jgi:MoaA/NifB/PqqE/SkfB family radical SAM enzyme
MNEAKKKVSGGSGFHEVSRSERADRWLESRSERYREYRRKCFENPENFIDEGFPLNIAIESSSACNLKCPMCFRTILMERGTAVVPGQFDYGLYRRIIDEAAKLGVYAVKLDWRGEPLMNPRITDMIRYAKENGIEDVQMNTNAVLLSKDMARRIIGAGLDSITFSFDSPYKKKYEAMRSGAVFDDVMENITNFRRVRDELGSVGPLATARMLRMPGDGVAEYMDFQDLFGGIVDVVAYADCNDFKRDYAFLKERKDIQFSCFQPWIRMVIDIGGNIGVCRADHDLSSGVGNLNTTTLYDAWNSPAYKAARERHRDGRWYDVRACLKCPMVAKSIE